MHKLNLSCHAQTRNLDIFKNWKLVTNPQKLYLEFYLLKINRGQTFIFSNRQHSVLWFILAIGCTFLIILTPFVWVGYLWTQIKDPHREMDVIPLPQNYLVRILFHSSNRVTGSSVRRTILYFCIAVLISFFAIIDVVSTSIE